MNEIFQHFLRRYDPDQVLRDRTRRAFISALNGRPCVLQRLYYSDAGPQCQQAGRCSLMFSAEWTHECAGAVAVRREQRNRPRAASLIWRNAFRTDSRDSSGSSPTPAPNRRREQRNRPRRRAAYLAKCFSHRPSRQQREQSHPRAEQTARTEESTAASLIWRSAFRTGSRDSSGSSPTPAPSKLRDRAAQAGGRNRCLFRAG